jgi:hypothetical protein
MDESLIDIAAYHEAGHAVVGHYLGFTVTEIVLSPSDPGAGITAFNYGNENLLMAAILSLGIDPSIFNSLPINEKLNAPQAIVRMTHTLLAGSISEAILKYGSGHVGVMEIHVNDSDGTRIEVLDALHRHINKSLPLNYVQGALLQLTETLRAPTFWNVIQTVAIALINSSNKSLREKEIAEIFEHLKFEKLSGS